jgi:flagellin
LSAGDLVINGVAVGNSTVLDDTSSTANSDASAISIAAAINRVSDRSDVTATVNPNIVGGTTFAGATSAGNVVINNITIDLSSDAGMSPEANLTSIAQAINERAGETGVRAEIASDPDGGINLVGEDGRNLELADGTAPLTNFGLAAANVYTGTYSLVSQNGSPIVIGSDSGNISNAGLALGSYSGSNSGTMSSVSNDLASDIPMAEGDLVVNGVPVGATSGSQDSASTANKNQSAISVAAAINAVSENTGVTAVPNENRVFSGNVTNAVVSFNVNGVAINVADQGDPTLQNISIVDAVNAKAGQTGVKAELLDGDSYILIAEDGRNIELTGTTGAAGDGLNDGVSGAAVTLISAGTIELSTNTGNIENSRLEVGKYGGGSTGSLIRDISISSVKEAEEAIIAIDNALQSVNIQRANLGAVQNRFESTISNQAITQENLSAANSRIKDADFASETAALSRSQVLQQAGTSILAQANALPQQVLSLLQ